MVLIIKSLAPADRPWLLATLEHWGGATMVTRGQVHDLQRLPGFIAFDGDERVGLALYRLAGAECELVSLDSLREGLGVGSALLEAVVGATRIAGCRRLWLITTNDNTHALRFYQRRGLRLVAIHREAVTAARHLKPGIPLLGNDDIPIRDEDDIPIRDEIELELSL